MYGHSRTAEKMTRYDRTRHQCVAPGALTRNTRKSRKRNRNVRQCSFDSCALISHGAEKPSAKKDPSSNGTASKDVVQLVRSAKNHMAKQVRVAAKMQLLARRFDTGQRSELEVFIEHIAYTFNRLFMVIQGYISLMLVNKENDHPQYAVLKRIEDLIHTESILINDLVLDLAKARSAKDHQLESLLENQICGIAIQLGFAGDPSTSTYSLQFCLEFVLCSIVTEIAQLVSTLAGQMNENQEDSARIDKIQQHMAQGYDLIRQIGRVGK